ncbi:MAG: TetR/AcrR family transcriptional regulator [Lachnotalea sp.]
MTKSNEKISARDKILVSAAKIFAKQSFDGARVDEIAKEAGVPKSLIYYHFKSKDEIFTVLTNDFLEKYKEIITKTKETEHSYDGEHMKVRMQNTYYPFGMQNENIVRATLIESIKKTNNCTVFFKMVQCLEDTDEDLTKEQKEHLIAEFFFNILPCMAYLCFSDSWIEFFGMKKADFDEMFLKQYNEMHGRYHKKRE